MCLYGVRGKYKKAFDTFVMRTSNAPATEEIFAECFGKPYNKFLIELRGYIDFTDYKYQEYKIKGKETLETPPPEMRDATEGESERLKADALRLAGKAASARNSVVAAYIRGERDPQFLTTLGQTELAAGNTDRARKFLEASAPKSPRPSVLLDLARLRFDEAAAKPGAPDQQFSDEQVSRVLSPLVAARNLPPAMPEVYQLMADTWLRAKTLPKPEAIIVLAGGLKLFPHDAPLIYRTAALNLRLGNHQAARALIGYGEKITQDDSVRAQLAQLKASLPALPAQ
jgi:hypothetical protein